MSSHERQPASDLLIDDDEVEGLLLVLQFSDLGFTNQSLI